MRVFPIIAAIVVSALVYTFVFERDRLLAYVRPAADTPTQAIDETPDVTPAQVAEGDTLRVVAVHSVARKVDTAVVLRGQTEADRQVDVRAETSGLIISEPLRKGTFVEKGKLLCRLDPATRAASLAEAAASLIEANARIPEAQARLTEARARVTEAEINANAASKLSEDGFASDTRVAATQAALSAARAAVQAAKSGVDATQAGIQSAEAEVAVAQKEIDRLDITAPFAGLLESDSAELGALLQPGALCATIIQLDPIILVGFVPETEVNKVRLGALAGAELASGDRVQGNVTFLSRSADPTTRTFRVEVEVANADLKLRDGQTAEIAISADGTDAHLLPQSVLTLNNSGDLGVRIVTADKMAKFVPITLLRDTPNGIWISGLPANADVIIIGQEYVTDGVMVEATYQEISQ